MPNSTRQDPSFKQVKLSHGETTILKKTTILVDGTGKINNDVNKIMIVLINNH